jgi:hypothetical protein
MNKQAQPFLNAHIRPVDPKDFAFIRALAGEFPTFTVPSDYVLWLFTHFHPDHCRVLEQDSGDLKAYLLAMPTSNPKIGIAIWQVAAAAPDRTMVLEYFAAYLRDLMERIGATSLFFTTQKDSASLRLIRVLAKQFGDCEVTRLDSVPARQGEYEFRLSLSKVPQ